jgi:hypothetical protein
LVVGGVFSDMCKGRNWNGLEVKIDAFYPVVYNNNNNNNIV